jgi:hypothetical protein
LLKETNEKNCSSDVLRVIAKKEKFTNFDVNFIPNPFQSVIDKWVAAGGAVHELVEPVDSLHPTQVENQQPPSYSGRELAVSILLR